MYAWVIDIRADGSLRVLVFKPSDLSVHCEVVVDRDNLSAKLRKIPFSLRTDQRLTAGEIVDGDSASRSVSERHRSRTASGCSRDEASSDAVLAGRTEPKREPLASLSGSPGFPVTKLSRSRFMTTST